jgi:hypothetical protein
MYVSSLQVLELIRKECAGVSEKVINWKLSELHFNSAVRAYFDGRLRDAAQLLQLAYRLDPLGTSHSIGSLIYRRGRKIILRAKRVQHSGTAEMIRTPFFHAHTRESIRPHHSALRHCRLGYVRRLDGANY